jgi:hypothetical protein
MLIPMTALEAPHFAAATHGFAGLRITELYDTGAAANACRNSQ